MTKFKSGELLVVSLQETGNLVSVWSNDMNVSSPCGTLFIGELVMFLEPPAGGVWGHRVLTRLGDVRISEARVCRIGEKT